LEDAFDELVLMDDDAKIPFYIGEIFVHQSLETTQVIKYNVICINMIFHNVKHSYVYNNDKNT